MNGLLIHHAGKCPIYLQIIEQIKQRVAVGVWVAGRPLPSIRQLAATLQVSVITVKRAYLELAREGVIQTRHGKGSQVAKSSNLRTQLGEAELNQHLEQAAKLAMLLNLGIGEMEDRLSAAAKRIAECCPAETQREASTI